MSATRKATAVFIGIATTLGYTILTSRHQEIISPKLVVGMIFGFAIACNMIVRPEKITCKQITYVMIPLLSGLTTWMAFNDPSKALGTFIWSTIFIAAHFVFLAAGRSNETANSQDTSSDSDKLPN